MGRKPLISVIMSVYNDEKYIRESLDSLLQQTLGDFEVIIIDDCSNDRTAELVEEYHEDRFHFIRNKENKGLTYNLNQAIAYASGTYIARMDGDDICLPERFEKQVEYLENHRNLMLISCRAQMFGEENLISRIQGSPQELKAMMLIRPVLAHPGFMMRGELVRDFGMRYDETFRSAQDYDFAVRTAERFDIGITKEVLLKYRVHKKQISSSRTGEQMNNADRVRRYQMDRLGIELGESQKEIYGLWAKEAKGMKAEHFYKAEALVKKIAGSNREKKLYDEKTLEETLRRLLYTWAIRNQSAGVFFHVFSICGWKAEHLKWFAGQMMEVMKSKLSCRRL